MKTLILATLLLASSAFSQSYLIIYKAEKSAEFWEFSDSIRYVDGDSLIFGEMGAAFGIGNYPAEGYFRVAAVGDTSLAIMEVRDKSIWLVYASTFHNWPKIRSLVKVFDTRVMCVPSSSHKIIDDLSNMTRVRDWENHVHFNDMNRLLGWWESP